MPNIFYLDSSVNNNSLCNTMTKNRLYSLDMMKSVAAIFITNSHFQLLYEGVNTAFATFGVQGNHTVNERLYGNAEVA